MWSLGGGSAGGELPAFLASAHFRHSQSGTSCTPTALISPLSRGRRDPGLPSARTRSLSLETPNNLRLNLFHVPPVAASLRGHERAHGSRTSFYLDPHVTLLFGSAGALRRGLRSELTVNGSPSSFLNEEQPPPP